MVFKIQKAAFGDLSFIKPLVSDEFSYLDLERFPFEEKIKNPDFDLWKIEVDGKFAGFLESEWIASWTVRINGIAIVPEFRRQGLAKTLLEHVFFDLKKRGADIILLLVAFDNDAAKKLYSEFGFHFESDWPEEIAGKKIEIWKLVVDPKPFSGVC